MPDAHRDLPSATTSSFTISPTMVGFAERPWQGYDVNGVAFFVVQPGGAAVGVQVRVALPHDKTPVATAILNALGYGAPSCPFPASPCG